MNKNQVSDKVNQNNFIKKITSYTNDSFDFDLLKISICYFDKHNYDISLFKHFDIDCPTSIKRSIKKRQSEFLAGRLMVKESLQKLSTNTLNVSIGKNREPIWPHNIIGSISHNENIAICIASKSSDYSYLGCDVETFIKIKTRLNISNAITNKVEKSLMLESSLSENIYFTLLFSAKESLFKALYPEVNRYFDFSVATVYDVDPQSQSFKIRLLIKLTNNLAEGTVFHGSYIIMTNSVATFITQIQR